MKFFILLISFMVIACESKNINNILKCEEHHGLCPVYPTNCEEFHLTKIPCSCDDSCGEHQKCCGHPCYTHKICVHALKQSVKHSHNKKSNNHTINPSIILKHTHKKSLKTTHDLEASNKQSYQNHPGYKPSVMHINIIYKIIKNIYVQNMHVYKDKDEIVDKKVDPTAELSEPSQTVTSSHEVNTQTTRILSTTSIPGCEDDEDCIVEKGSGTGPVVTDETTESPERITTEDLDGSGSGDVEIKSLDLENPQQVKDLVKILKSTDGSEIIIVKDNDNLDPDITFDE